MKKTTLARHCHGFTLLELMVVLVLMGIILSMTTLTVGDGGHYRRLEEEANRLLTLVTMARDEAVLRSQDWILVFKEQAYRFDQEKVEEVEGTPKAKTVPIKDKIFRPRELDGYRLSVVVEDAAYPVETPRDDAEDEVDIIGRVTIYSSGEMTEFELTLRPDDGDDYFILKASPLGELTLIGSRDDEV